MKTKFKVGQTVRLTATPEISLFILEINQQVCYANTIQNWYTGRVVYRGERRAVGKLERFSEIELAPLPKPSAKLVKLETEFQQLQRTKRALLKNQEYEKASELRSKLGNLQLDIDLHRELEGLTVDYNRSIL